MNNILEEIKNEFNFSNMEELDNLDLEMLEMAEYFDSLDAEDFDDFDAEEAEEYAEFLEMLEDAEHKRRHGSVRGRFHRKGGHRSHGHRKHGHRRHGLHKHGHSAHRHGSSRRAGPHTDKALAAVGGGGGWAQHGSASNSPKSFGSPDYIHELMTRTKGDLNITITRPTANIAAPLPYILFGLNGFSSSFISTLKNYLPAGVTCAASADPLTGDMLLTYTAAGPLVDVVRVSLTGSQISYTEFLQNMNANFFKTRFIRQEYQDTANLLTSVSQTINFGLLSALGSKNANNLLPRSRRLTSDFQTFIINLLLDEQKITSDFSFVQNIINVANTTIAWDVFMSARTNLNNV